MNGSRSGREGRRRPGGSCEGHVTPGIRYMGIYACMYMYMYIAKNPKIHYIYVAHTCTTALTQCRIEMYMYVHCIHKSCSTFAST